MKQCTYKITVYDNSPNHYYTEEVEAYDPLEALKKFINEWSGEITYISILKRVTLD